MAPKVLYIERKYWKKDGLAFSIEKVFASVASRLGRFTPEFVKLPYGNGFLDILRNLLRFRPGDADIIHITGQVHYIALALPRKNTLLTVHDLGFLHLRKGLRRYILKKLFLDWPLRRLRYVTAVSEASKAEIIRFAPWAAEKIEVIENPLFDEYAPRVVKEFDAECPTILQVGVTANKNIPRLLEALEGIECRLRVVGTADDDLRAMIETASVDAEIISGLTDEEMRREYENADIVAFCSTYEGFGLPILEAQAMQRPLITSDLSPMREVAGGGAVLVDPFDANAIRAGILDVVRSANLRAEITERGRSNVARFDPSAIAARYERLYLQVMDEK